MIQEVKGHRGYLLAGGFLLPLLGLLQDFAFGGHDGSRSVFECRGRVDGGGRVCRNVVVVGGLG